MEVLVARLVYLSHFDLFRNEARREYVATTHARRKFTSDSHQIIIGVSSDSLFDSHRIVFSIVFLAVQDSSIGDIVTESVSQSLSHF